ncbi:MAG TPA: formylglycine-generating enzyme family protein [Planctomycetota bacterium]|nr:formylglycine-generating enzyme family protein [Planctomycetota bacterium]
MDPEPPAVPLTAMAEIPSGEYAPMYPGKDDAKRVPIAAFQTEIHPVTNAQFLRFVWENPEWSRSQVPRLFADSQYLEHWTSDFAIDPNQASSPVNNVSWFAARAYAEWAGRRLLTLAEWEYLAAASETAAMGRDDPAYNQLILRWYSLPTPPVPGPVGQQPANFFGVQDLHGLVWEWVEDFNTALITGESRGDGGLDRNLFCGSGSLGAADPKDYAAFMRFAFRSSLRANYTVRNLGFRCGHD